MQRKFQTNAISVLGEKFIVKGTRFTLAGGKRVYLFDVCIPIGNQYVTAAIELESISEALQAGIAVLSNRNANFRNRIEQYEKEFQDEVLRRDDCMSESTEDINRINNLASSW